MPCWLPPLPHLPFIANSLKAVYFGSLEVSSPFRLNASLSAFLYLQSVKTTTDKVSANLPWRNPVICSVFRDLPAALTEWIILSVQQHLLHLAARTPRSSHFLLPSRCSFLVSGPPFPRLPNVGVLGASTLDLFSSLYSLHR